MYKHGRLQGISAMEMVRVLDLRAVVLHNGIHSGWSDKPLTVICVPSIYLHPCIFYILLWLVFNMARYCMSVQKYFPKPKARKNTAHECYVSPYWAMRDLLLTSL